MAEFDRPSSPPRLPAPPGFHMVERKDASDRICLVSRDEPDKRIMVKRRYLRERSRFFADMLDVCGEHPTSVECIVLNDSLHDLELFAWAVLFKWKPHRDTAASWVTIARMADKYDVPDVLRRSETRAWEMLLENVDCWAAFDIGLTVANDVLARRAAVAALQAGEGALAHIEEPWKTALVNWRAERTRFGHEIVTPLLKKTSKLATEYTCVCSARLAAACTHHRITLVKVAVGQAIADFDPASDSWPLLQRYDALCRGSYEGTDVGGLRSATSYIPRTCGCRKAREILRALQARWRAETPTIQTVVKKAGPNAFPAS